MCPAGTRRLLTSSPLDQTNLPAFLDNTKKKNMIDLRNHGPRSALVRFFFSIRRHLLFVLLFLFCFLPIDWSCLIITGQLASRGGGVGGIRECVGGVGMVDVRPIFLTHAAERASAPARPLPAPLTSAAAPDVAALRPSSLQLSAAAERSPPRWMTR